LLFYWGTFLSLSPMSSALIVMPQALVTVGFVSLVVVVLAAVGVVRRHSVGVQEAVPIRALVRLVPPQLLGLIQIIGTTAVMGEFVQ
jgi:hypothetical protein